MSYWVYENWMAENKAVIHKGSCGHCQEGRGCHTLKHPGKNGRWHGPFRTLAAARTEAKATKRPVHKHNCVK